MKRICLLALFLDSYILKHFEMIYCGTLQIE
jgi:hypothetical protein